MAEQKPGNDDKGEYVWIQLHHPITPKKWCSTEKTVRLINDEYVLTQWGVKAVTKYKPQLSNGAVNFIDTEKDICVYYHRDITFEFILNSPEDSDHMELTVKYIPQSMEKQSNFMGSKGCHQCHHHYLTQYEIQSSLNSNLKCRSYIWIFDISLVKMIFRSPNNTTKTLTKRFHVEMDCQRSDSYFKQGIVTEFTNSEFISKTDFERDLDYKMDLTNDDRFIPVDVEITARFKLVSLSSDGQIVDADCLTEKPRIFSTRFLSRESDSLSFAAKQSFVAITSSKKVEPACTAVAACSHIYYGTAHDVVIQIGSEVIKSLPVHSCILKCASPVFNKMLSLDMAEGNSRVIVLEESVSAPALEMFLQFLYHKMGWNYYHCNYCNHDHGCKNYNFQTLDNWTAAMSVDVLQLAHKYQVLDLYEVCIDSIISRPDSEFDFELAEEISEASRIYEESDLTDRCDQWMKRHGGHR